MKENIHASEEKNVDKKFSADRRKLLIGAGSVGLGAMAMAASGSITGISEAFAGSDHHAHGKPNQAMTNAANNCVKTGEACIVHCLDPIKGNKGGNAMRNRIIICLMFFGLAGTAMADCGKAAGLLSVSNAYVREMPPGTDTTAAYFTLLNRGSRDVEIVGASSPLSHAAEVHATMEKHGMAHMQHQKGVVLPAGKPVVFKPGGMHLMLIGLKNRLKAGDKVPITLHFADGRKLAFEAKVRDMRHDALEHHH